MASSNISEQFVFDNQTWSLPKLVSPVATSDKTTELIIQVFTIINNVILCSVFGATGIVANTLNICVFLKQGLNSSITLSFLAISISDVFSLLALLWRNICLDVYINSLLPDVVLSEFEYLTAAWPHGISARITSWITVYITAERCLSIAAPLKVKQIVTPRRTVIVLLSIFLVNMLSLVPEYSTVYYDWKYYPDRNKTILGLAFRGNRAATQSLVFYFLTAFAIGVFISVTTFTCVLVYKLKQTSKWRQSSTSDQAQNESITARDKKIVALVISVATVLMICYTPTVILSIFTVSIPGFSVSGKYDKYFKTSWSFAFLLHAINSNMNFILYFKMSSSYRNKFKELLCFRNKNKETT
ncbi:uncharacterized protein LOC131957005 [Physella acuta]|uniref:uncharacterized protein LOC131957005 n=1 Tax=Physella acuta TaxID=109671 RepID=UPI0027DDC2D6|nr:uncharacterized protein LOC131957005 [Physella acuta]